MMEQLLLHLLGDFVIQNDWMALNKKKPGAYGFFACLIHCATYSLPFAFITGWSAVLLIFACHFIIDRYNLVTVFLSLRNGCDRGNFGFGPDRPIWLTVWLNIITDNTFHLTWNYVVIAYFAGATT